MDVVLGPDLRVVFLQSGVGRHRFVPQSDAEHPAPLPHRVGGVGAEVHDNLVDLGEASQSTGGQSSAIARAELSIEEPECWRFATPAGPREARPARAGVEHAIARAAPAERQDARHQVAGAPARLARVLQRRFGLDGRRAGPFRPAADCR